jgi:hypothetical protein
LKNLKGILKYTISLGIGIALMAWVFNGIPLSNILERLLEVNYFWVVLTILIGIMSHWLRAFRWNILLEPVHGPVSIKSTFPIVLSMYLVNLAIPRGGEVYRCGALKKTDEVPVFTSIGTVIAERIFDLFFLAVLLLVMILLEADKFAFLLDELGPSYNSTVEHGTIILSAFILLILLSFATVVRINGQ